MLWDEVKLGDVVSFIDGDRGKNYPRKAELQPNGYCLFLDTGNVTKEGFSTESCNYITKEKDELLNKGKLKRKDVVVTTRGTLGNAFYYSDSIPFSEVRINSGMLILRVEDKLDSRFLYYVIKSPHVQRSIDAVRSGSAQPQIPVKTFREILVPLPPLTTQKRIAEVLGAYDELIENNKLQIKLLEEALLRLYKHWFVDFDFPGVCTTPFTPDGLPQGWRRGTLGEIVELLNGYAFKSKTFDEQGEFKIATIKNVQDGAFQQTPANKIKEIPQKMPVHCKLAKGDILLSLTGNVGRVCVVNANNFLLNQRVAKVNSKHKWFAYCMFRNPNLANEIRNIANGSAQKNLSPIKTVQIKTTVPAGDILDEYEQLVQPFFGKILALYSQISLVREARDRLLPKIMSGDVEV